MGKNVTAKPGRYRVSSTPYQKQPQEAFTDPEVQTTVLYWAKRLGKTEMINNLHGATMEQNPRNILHVMPTLDSAKKWSKQFLMPMIRSTPALRRLIREARAKDANNTILAKEFPNGTISAIGANSPSGFRQVQAPVVTCDEIDAMENGPEGDPVTLAFGRAENYPDSIQVVSSTATRIISSKAPQKQGESSGSRIHDWWLKSDQRKWFAKCPLCQEHHVLAWSNVRWPEGHKHAEAVYECPHCGSHWDDTMRVAAICAGEWRPTAPFNGIRGYWLNGIYTTFPPKKGYKTKLHQMAAEFYDAYTSGEEARTTWKNTFLCEPVEETAEVMEPDALYGRLEVYTPQRLPNKVALVVVGADLQGDRVEAEFIGYGLHEETWGIENVVVSGNINLPEFWSRVTVELDRTFKREDGIELCPLAIGFDCHYRPELVKAWCRQHGTRIQFVYPVMGIGEHQDRITILRPTGIHTIATDRVKDKIYSCLQIDVPGPRYQHFPNSYTAAWFRQLTCERVVTKYVRGFPKREYVKTSGARNEALDKRVYADACLDILRPDIAAIAAQLEPRKPEEPAPPPRSAGGWFGGGGWRV